MAVRMLTMGHQDLSFGVKRAKKKKKGKKVIDVVGNIVINHIEIEELLKKKKKYRKSQNDQPCASI